jgi:biotin carboxylase
LKKTLLIAGGSHSEIPLIRAGQALGYFVVTTGNNPSDLGHQYADRYLIADYSDKDALLAVARKINVDVICPGCNDFAALSSSYVADVLKLPGHDISESTKTIHHKDRFREFARRIGLSSPDAVSCQSELEVDQALDMLDAPVLVKPVDLSGGKGIHLASNKLQARAFAKQALSLSRQNRIVVEKFISGTKHGLSMILKNQKVHFHFTDNEQYHLSPFLVSGASTPTSCAPQSILKLINESEAIAKNLKLIDGIFHMQFIEKEPGHPVIIEICRRPPGDLYLELVRHATGIPYSELLIQLFGGGEIPNLPLGVNDKYITRHCLMATDKGFLDELCCDSNTAKKIIDAFIWARRGDKIENPATHKLGIVFIDHGSLEKMKIEIPLLPKLIYAKVSESLSTAIKKPPLTETSLLN